jgi:Thiol-activated cytolysin
MIVMTKTERIDPVAVSKEPLTNLTDDESQPALSLASSNEVVAASARKSWTNIDGTDADYRTMGYHDNDLIRDGTGAVYLLEDGWRWILPDQATFQRLEQGGRRIREIKGDLLGRIPQAGTLSSFDLSGVFYVNNEDGTRSLYYAERGAVYQLEGTEEQVTAYFGTALPLSSVLPSGRLQAFVAGSQRISLAEDSTDNWFAIREYLQSIAPPPVTDPPGLTIDTSPPTPAAYTAEGGVGYTVQAATQTIRNLINRFPVVSPVADAIWPGAILQGNSLASGLLAPVQIEDRTPGTLTVATELVVGNHGAPTSVLVDRPTQATVTTARRRLMEDLAVQASTGRVDLQLATMRDEQQMSARLGVKLSGSGWKTNADVNVSGSLDVSKTVLKLTQEFYTITFEPSGSPARYFGDAVTVDMLRQFSGPGNAPCYVHQVTYGRVVLLTIESSESASEVRAKVEAAWQAAVSGDVQAQASMRSATKAYNVQLAAVGITGQTAFLAVGSLMDALRALSNTANYGPGNPGEVISYSVRYLLDGTVATAVLGPYNYPAFVRADVPVTATSYEVWDDSSKGVPGGKSTGIVLRPGDRVNVTSFGSVWAGWWLSGRLFGPAGDTSQHGRTIGNDTKPLRDVAFTALLYGFGQGWFYWAANPSFIFGQTTQRDPNGQERLIGSATTPLRLFVHINDDHVDNGGGKFFGQILVQRRPLAGVDPI